MISPMLTKAEVGKLSVEQQETLAQLELRQAQRRQKLLEQARGLDWRSRYFPLYISGIFLVFISAYYFNFFRCQEQPSIFYFPAGMVVVFTLVFHITRTNRRLDALLELLNLESDERSNCQIESGKKTG